MATFITTQSVGESINIGVYTSTGYWKYNHNGSDWGTFMDGTTGAQVANANGEFTILPCSSDGTVSGSITNLDLGDNQLTSFNGTGLTSLTNLNLRNNQLTSFNGTGLTSLTGLVLSNNQLTSFDSTGLSGLTNLDLDNNLLTTLDISNFNLLQYLYVQNNQLTPSVNNSLLVQLAANELANDWDSGEFYTTGGRTSAGTTDYDYLIANGWDVKGVDLVVNPTFITSKLTGETIRINVQTSTGYWKYNHNGTDSSVFNQGDGYQLITIENANGEFTLIPCLSNGTVSGDITQLVSKVNQLTSFDGTGLSSLTNLNLNDNQLTSVKLDGLLSLNTLYIGNNPIPALVNNQILADLVGNNVSNGYLYIDGSPNLVRTTASNSNYDYLTMDLSWTVNGTYSFPSSGLGKIRVKGITQI